MDNRRIHQALSFSRVQIGWEFDPTSGCGAESYDSLPEHWTPEDQMVTIPGRITSVIFPVHTERSRITLNRHQEVKTVMNIWAKTPGLGRAQFSALRLFFFCLGSSLLFAQTSTSDIQKADIQKAAAAGDAQAQFALANDYFRRRYVTLNYAEMLSWYRKSAAQGFAPAQNQLGSMYENNVGVGQDYKRAATYYRLAANQGFAPAQYNLAGLFEAGHGVHRDYKQAIA